MGRLIKMKQQGFVLFMTLVTLVMLTVSGLVMMRVMEAGVSAAGNIAFRQAASRVADTAIEDAMTWLKAESGKVTLETTTNDGNGNTIYIPSAEAFDPVSYDWEGGASHKMTATDKISGYDVYYVIHRMAQAAGSCKSATDNSYCMYAPNSGSTGTTTEGSSQGGGTTYSGFISGSSGLVYYRVTVKVSGPRNNVSYVQAFLY